LGAGRGAVSGWLLHLKKSKLAVTEVSMMTAAGLPGSSYINPAPSEQPAPGATDQ
jgi:hypothetical protein